LVWAEEKLNAARKHARDSCIFFIYQNRERRKNTGSETTWQPARSFFLKPFARGGSRPILILRIEARNVEVEWRQGRRLGGRTEARRHSGTGGTPANCDFGVRPFLSERVCFVGLPQYFPCATQHLRPTQKKGGGAEASPPI
jgi:hypothetical protein